MTPNPRKTVLLTAAREDSEILLSRLEKSSIRALHTPLEKYTALDESRILEPLKSNLEASENIIYGHKRNARFLLRLVEKNSLGQIIRHRLNLASDLPTAEYLEKHGIPAVYPGHEKPVGMLEFMMRLRRIGPTFYPTGRDGIPEEIPALLAELGVEVYEQSLYRLEGPSDEELSGYRKVISQNHIDAVICHSRRSVSRIRAAFPELSLERVRVIAGDRGVTEKLDKAGIETDCTAGGNWDSIFEKVRQL